jgi:hypothetical protein
MRGKKGLVYTSRLYIRLDDKTTELLKEAVYKNRTTVSEYVRDMIIKHFSVDEQPNEKEKQID